MVLRNGYVFIEGQFRQTDIKISGDKIQHLGQTDDMVDVIDCTGKYVIPGLMDIHTHGCVGYDFSTASPSDISKMQQYYLENGITSIMPTTVSMSNEDIIKARDNIETAMKNDTLGAKILGINMEGPYLSPHKCGAHDISVLKEPDIDFVNSLGDIIKIVNIAPEYENAMNFIENYKGKCSIAHTDCDYETAKEAIDKGADHITHIFNAMNGLHHRNPGVIGAFFDTKAYAEIICDSIHIAPPVLRMMFSAKGDRLIIISDSMAATGLDNGEYTLGHLHVRVNNSVATLEDGTLAGSVMNVMDMVKNLIDMGVKRETAVSAATENAADAIEMGTDKGYLTPGHTADIVITDEKFSIHKVYSEGRQLINKM